MIIAILVRVLFRKLEVKEIRRWKRSIGLLDCFVKVDR